MSNTAGDGCRGSVPRANKTETDRAACTENLTETDAFIRSSLALDPAEEYKMDNKHRGIALIFNQERFFWRLGLNDRQGTNADRYNLEKRLRDLNFDVQACDNYKQVEVLDKVSEGKMGQRKDVGDFDEGQIVLTRRPGQSISRTAALVGCSRSAVVRTYQKWSKEGKPVNRRQAAEANHSDADCFLLVFLSHGENDHVYTYDGKISIQDITSLFKGNKCRSLVGKPKIFILQACRGDKHDEPVTACDAVDSELNEVVVDASAVHTLPAGADFIMCYSVAEGYYSHRETINGSWYVQDLCELLQKYGNHLEFTELLTLVNRKVSMRSVGNSSDRNAIGKKQVPCFASMLTKKLYFRPKQ